MADRHGAPVVACVDWVDLAPEIDPLHAIVSTDVRRFGFSDADRAALETALRLGEAWGAPVWVLTAAPPAAEPALAELAASGADRAVRMDGLEIGASVGRIGAALADVCRGSRGVVCGDLGLVGGTGAVPAMIAHHLRAAQALGVVRVEPDAAAVRAVRRLDGGRREVVRVESPFVISTEGSVARLRRAGLDRLTGATTVDIVSAGAAAAERSPVVATTTWWRPRPRDLPAPSADDPRQRIIALTGALVDRTPPRRIEQPPAAAADAILAQLRDWGYDAPGAGP